MHRFLDSAHGRFTFPDPNQWPAAAVEQFRRATEPRTLRDVFIFSYEQTAALYLEDAVTALTVLPVAQDEWFTDLGYPSFVFALWKIEGFTQRLEAAGYRVWIMEQPAQQQNLEETAKVIKAKVVNIADARGAFARRRRWA